MGLFSKKPEPIDAALVSVLAELRIIHAAVEKLNVPVIADDYDAGYDTAVDEVLGIISDRMKIYTSKP